MAKKVIDVPFSPDGKIHSVHPWYRGITKPNYIFTDTLAFEDTSSSTSSTHVEWRSTITGIRYTTTITELDKILIGTSGLTVTLTPILTISGDFTFRKQGTSVFLTFANDNTITFR